MDEKGGIGHGNRLPWHLSSDLKRFKSLTMGHHLIMGRKTFGSIGKILPGRTMIIVTHDIGYHPEGCIVVNSIEEALRIAMEAHEIEVFIIGGGEVFKQTINIANKIYLTNVHVDAKADVFFPKIDSSLWKSVWNEAPSRDEKDEYESDFKVLMRINYECG
jgi:dihydrofolate reductase